MDPERDMTHNVDRAIGLSGPKKQHVLNSPSSWILPSTHAHTHRIAAAPKPSIHPRLRLLRSSVEASLQRASKLSQLVLGGRPAAAAVHERTPSSEVDGRIVWRAAAEIPSAIKTHRRAAAT